MKLTLLAGVACMVLNLLAPPVPAQKDGDPVSIGTYRVIESEALGETRRLLVHLPRGYEGSNIRYPVVYHLYGSNLEQYYTEAVKVVEELANEARMPQMILVGIDNIDRYRDLRPVMRDGSPSGIERYTKYLADEVFPFVEAQYRTSPYRIVVGPQAGAVFCLYALQRHTGLFDAFILNNPLVDPRSNEILFGDAEDFYKNTDPLKKFFFITYGDVDDRPETIENVERFAGLAEPARDRGFDLRLNRLADNDDFIPPTGLKKALRALFDEYYVPRDRVFSGLDEITAFYGGLSDKYGYDVAVAEIVMAFSAEALRRNGQAEKAVEIMEYSTSLYPNMINPWWHLATAVAETGDTERAIRLYQKCVEIDPSMKNFVDRRIESLKKNG